jgi:hypothetical protein
MATGVLGLQFLAVVYPAMVGPRPEPDLVTTHPLTLMGKIVMEKAQTQWLAVSHHVQSVSISNIFVFLKVGFGEDTSIIASKDKFVSVYLSTGNIY